MTDLRQHLLNHRQRWLPRPLWPWLLALVGGVIITASLISIGRTIFNLQEIEVRAYLTSFNSLMAEPAFDCAESRDGYPPPASFLSLHLINPGKQDLEPEYFFRSDDSTLLEVSVVLPQGKLSSIQGPASTEETGPMVMMLDPDITMSADAATFGMTVGAAQADEEQEIDHLINVCDPKMELDQQGRQLALSPEIENKTPRTLSARVSLPPETRAVFHFEPLQKIFLDGGGPLPWESDGTALWEFTTVNSGEGSILLRMSLPEGSTIDLPHGGSPQGSTRSSASPFYLGLNLRRVRFTNAVGTLQIGNSDPVTLRAPGMFAGDTLEFSRPFSDKASSEDTFTLIEDPVSGIVELRGRANYILHNGVQLGRRTKIAEELQKVLLSLLLLGPLGWVRSSAAFKDDILNLLQLRKKSASPTPPPAGSFVCELSTGDLIAGQLDKSRTTVAVVHFSAARRRRKGEIEWESTVLKEVRIPIEQVSHAYIQGTLRND